MAFVRACAASLFFGALLVAGPAAAASYLETRDRLDPRSEPFDQAIGQAGGSEPISAARLEARLSGKATAHPVWNAAGADALATLTTPGDGPEGVFVPPQRRAHSVVPLPTGLSLFGSGILTLGLIGLFSGSSRRMALDAGMLTDMDQAAAAVEAPPPVRFRIDIQRDHACQVRHTVSARGTIDLIADLLNDGWDLICIRDRNGLAVDYDDVIAAWNNERRADR